MLATIRNGHTINVQITVTTKLHSVKHITIQERKMVFYGTAKFNLLVFFKFHRWSLKDTITIIWNPNGSPTPILRAILPTKIPSCYVKGNYPISWRREYTEMIWDEPRHISGNRKHPSLFFIVVITCLSCDTFHLLSFYIDGYGEQIQELDIWYRLSKKPHNKMPR